MVVVKFTTGLVLFILLTDSVPVDLRLQ